MLPDTAKLTAEFEPELLNGVTVVKGRAVALQTDADGKVRRPSSRSPRSPTTRGPIAGAAR